MSCERPRRVLADPAGVKLGTYEGGRENRAGNRNGGCSFRRCAILLSISSVLAVFRCLAPESLVLEVDI